MRTKEIITVTIVMVGIVAVGYWCGGVIEAFRSNYAGHGNHRNYPNVPMVCLAGKHRIPCTVVSN